MPLGLYDYTVSQSLEGDARALPGPSADHRHVAVAAYLAPCRSAEVLRHPGAGGHTTGGGPRPAPSPGRGQL